MVHTVGCIASWAFLLSWKVVYSERRLDLDTSVVVDASATVQFNVLRLMKETFTIADINMDGSVNQKELMILAKADNPHYDEAELLEDVRSDMSEFDSDTNGLLSKTEFLDMMLSQGGFDDSEAVAYDTYDASNPSHPGHQFSREPFPEFKSFDAEKRDHHLEELGWAAEDRGEVRRHSRHRQKTGFALSHLDEEDEGAKTATHDGTADEGDMKSKAALHEDMRVSTSPPKEDAAGGGEKRDADIEMDQTREGHRSMSKTRGRRKR
eukprot:TRINITY_DN14285_c0_g1_i1.p1 TRINITY_DN14285_c0_g1~~TRINITY_DN14285_c0_g1_i1.p1  ORF type:complete len:266 (-),score=43.65 TRINITY_DN14285_c0_g1_i1:90-887(-)